MRDMSTIELAIPALPPWRPTAVRALVWGADGDHETEAVEHLRGEMWPGRAFYEITEVRRVPRGVPCPLRRAGADVLAYELRDGWMWIIVTSSAVTACA